MFVITENIMKRPVFYCILLSALFGHYTESFHCIL